MYVKNNELEGKGYSVLSWCCDVKNHIELFDLKLKLGLVLGR